MNQIERHIAETNARIATLNATASHAVCQGADVQPPECLKPAPWTPEVDRAYRARLAHAAALQRWFRFLDGVVASLTTRRKPDVLFRKVRRFENTAFGPMDRVSLERVDG